MEKSDLSSSHWLTKPSFPPGKQVLAHGLPLSLERKKFAARSAKVSALIKENPQVKLSSAHFQDMPTDKETFELVARFCLGYELVFSSENVIQLICLANYLEMTESHSKNNLLDMAVRFFEERVLPSWDETIKALRSAGCALQEAVRLGLFQACVESLVEKVQADPHLIGEPMMSSTSDEESGDDAGDNYRRKARERLFDLDWKSEDLTVLPIQLYQPIIRAMNKHQIPHEYVAASLCRYVEKWVLFSGEGENVSIYKRNSQRDVIEAVESLLPDEKGLVPCMLLSKLLKFAISLDSNSDCINGLEYRIGKQLDQATVKDLLLSNGYNTKEMQYDTECLRRIAKHFYGNYSSSSDTGPIAVAEIFEEFLVEVASDIDLKIDTFLALSTISNSASAVAERSADGLYRAVDIYLDKHRYLTENEREEVCRMLDCQKMSYEACEHAVNNGRLPLRFVVQILFVSQLQMRGVIANQVHGLSENLQRDEVREDKENEVKVNFDDEEEVRSEMEKMSIKMMELEKECCTIKQEIQNACNNCKSKKGKTGLWKEMKRKLGCMSSTHDCNCQVNKKKKVHPKH